MLKISHCWQGDGSSMLAYNETREVWGIIKLYQPSISLSQPSFFPALPLSPLARIQCHMWLCSSSHPSQHVTPAHDIICILVRQSFLDIQRCSPLKQACCVTRREGALFQIPLEASLVAPVCLFLV